MQRVDVIRENARRKSVKPYVKFTYKGETIKLSKKKLKKLLKKAVVMVMLIVAVSKVGPVVVDKISYALDVKDVALEQSIEANSLLADYDLHVVPDQNNYWGNDYARISELSESDLYGFYQYCGYTEAENVVRALGFESWDNYLSMKGYFDKDGKPSIRVWENYEEARLVTEKREAKENGRNY